MQRISAILGHLQPTPGDEDIETAIRHEAKMQQLRVAFNLSTARMKQLTMALLGEMLEGLRDEERANVKMLCSYVAKRPTSQVSGSFFALDLGGTNFRVLQVEVRNGQIVDARESRDKIPDDLKVGDSDALMDFIAVTVRTFLGPNYASIIGGLGFTFSFPVAQTSINSGKLITWTKGFAATGLVGADVVAALQRAFVRAGLKLTIAALCNDTVGTLITEYFGRDTAAVGVILGTGSNACYWEKLRNIPKLPKGFVGDHNADDEMVINMEWGNFDCYSTGSKVLPLTAYDLQVDKATNNPGRQRYEKMMSGLYMGELARLMALDLIKEGMLPESLAAGLSEPYSFHSQEVSKIEADKSPDLAKVASVLSDKFGITTAGTVTLRQRAVLHEICGLVFQRGARFAAVGVSACLIKIEANHPKRKRNWVVAIDGSVFEKVQGFREEMQRALNAILDDGVQRNVTLTLTAGGSGIGAALIAALAGTGKN